MATCAELTLNSDCSLPNGLEIKSINESVGKGIFATKSYTSGEILFHDSPLISTQFAWNYLYNYKACDYCLRALETAEENVKRMTANPTLELPHPDCCEVKKEYFVECQDCGESYCSEECLTKAWADYHKILCVKSKKIDESHPIKILDDFWRSMHYPPETFNIMLIVKLLVRLHLDKDNNFATRISQFCSTSKSDNESFIHKLLGEEFAEKIETLRTLVSNVVNFDNIQQWLTSEGFMSLFLLIGRNGQGIASSSFSTWVHNVEKLKDQKVLDKIDKIYEDIDNVVGQFMDNEGSGLFPLQSFLNHSCVPNAEIRFPYKNNVIGIFTTKNIGEGDEITISYLEPGELERSRYSRNKKLREHYLFTCNCEKCLSEMDQDDCTSEEEDCEMEDEEKEEMN